MFALMGELNLWTFDDNVNIKDTDFGGFKYHDKRISGTYQEGKRSYCEKRDMIYVPVNKKGNRLKDYMKYLEDQLKDNSIIYCQWYSDRIAQIMFNNGLLVHIQIYPFSGDIEKINFDKYLVGKLSEHASDVIITKSHIVCTYNDNEVTVVYLTKPKSHVFDSISKLEPKLITTDVFVPNGRKLDKKVQVNKSEDLILIWWKSTMNEVYPWSPAMREYHRANMHLFRLTGTKLESLCYIRTEFDPLCITFDACDDNIIHSVEQKVSRKGEVTVEWRTYEVSQQNKLQRIAVISVPLPTHTSCVKFSPNQELLLLCCIDGTITMYDPTKAMTTSARAAFIPTLAAWHSDGMIFVLGNDRGQLQHFNIALQCIKSQTLSDEATPANILDLSPYFRNQPALIHMEWNKKNDPNYVGFYNNGNSLFLLLFERGPIGVLKVIEGDSLTGDELVRRYLSGCQIKQATYLLLSMNWDTHPRACMHSLNQILNYLFKLPLTTNHDGLIQNALGSFHVPARPISQAVEEEYGNEVRDLTRRYFHRLLRCRMFEKAFRLAIDLNDHDLFMDIHFSAVALNDMELAIAAKERAENILSRSNSRRSSHSTCSRASCSLCSDSSDEKDEEEEEEEETYSEESGDSRKQERAGLKQSKRHNYRKVGSNQIPPLPIVNPHRDLENSLPAPYTDIPSSNKSDYNLMPASFDAPSSGILTTAAFNHSSPMSISSSFLASTSFNKPLYKTHSNFSSSANTTNIIDSSSAFNNASDDLMTTSFGSLSLTESEVTVDNQPAETFGETSYDKPSLLNEIPYSFNGASANMVTACAQGDSFVSTAFNKPVYESEDTRPEYPSSSLDTIDSNIMSTSFSTRVPSTLISHNNPFNVLTANSKSETTCPMSRNAKSSSELSDNTASRTLTEVLTTSKSSSSSSSSILYGTCNNLMSTSFNYPEADVASINDTYIDAFNSGNNQAVKLQHPIAEKKETVFNIPPPPPSLTSSRTNYLHGLPRKNYPLSRSSPGLTSDIDDSVHKFSSYKTHMPLSSRILQRQNSTTNIPQNQKIPSRIYRYNYDLDYVPFHHGATTCDDADSQRSPQTVAAGSRKFDPLQNLQSSYSVQRRLLESRHLSRSSQSNVSINASKEVKMSCNVPPLPVINTSMAKIYAACPSFSCNTPVSSNEKPKVKFSDTVTHILVPPSAVHRQKRPPVQTHLTDHKRELAESLPLGLSNEDYLKDLPSLSKDDTDEKMRESPKSDDSTKIKVVHFGLL
ncbi:WD repeat-containing and planar cell polarity effector protein fritz [Odontomachus brunneus]|uniref:WD repeat-containing and planar cell polarity effector protein fritz n=1 Tax=Odontomachus brunneus TaxID=486640 RepID=UPI0013F219CF|nr:WD repeat-containing and planar cell polarity effector protein fritz [Odontomachus brunneus]